MNNELLSIWGGGGLVALFFRLWLKKMNEHIAGLETKIDRLEVKQAECEKDREALRNNQIEHIKVTARLEAKLSKYEDERQ